MEVITNCCRICLGKENLTDLFEQPSCTIVNKIMYCASVQIEHEDNFPQKICKQCLYYLDCGYIFKTVCEETDKKLHGVYENGIKQLNGCSEFDSLETCSVKGDNNHILDCDSIFQKDLDVVEYVVYNHYEDSEQKVDLQLNCNNLDEATEIKYKGAHSQVEQFDILSSIPLDGGFNGSKNVKEEKVRRNSKSLAAKSNKIQKLVNSPVGRHIAKKNASKCPQRYRQSDVIKTRSLKNKGIILNDVILSQSQKDHSEEVFEENVVEESDNYILENDMPMGLYMETVVSEEPNGVEINDLPETIVENNEQSQKPLVEKIVKRKIKSDRKARLSPIKLRKGNRKINVFIDQNTVKKSHCTKNFKEESNAEEIALQCDVCRKTFPYRSHLIRHLNVHTGIKRYSCEYCSKKFINTYNLSVHIRKHTGDFPLSCKVCNKGFTTPSVLKRHMLSHTGDTNYECKFCSKKFAHSSSLKFHETMHLSRPKYNCDVCFKIYSYKTSLAAHKKTHLRIKNHNCNVCHKDFSRKTSLDRHMLGHSNLKKIKCKFCNVWFSHSSSYATHVRLHSNHDCEFCDQSFLTKGLLANHVKKHKKECFKCDQCCKKFTHKLLLVKHLQKHVNM